MTNALMCVSMSNLHGEDISQTVERYGHAINAVTVPEIFIKLQYCNGQCVCNGTKTLFGSGREVAARGLAVSWNN